MLEVGDLVYLWSIYLDTITTPLIGKHQEHKFKNQYPPKNLFVWRKLFCPCLPWDEEAVQC